MTAESFDLSALRGVIQLPSGENWGTLKSLEKVLGTIINPDDARALLTPLVGIYELRGGDAHLPSSDIEEAFALVNISPTDPPIEKGKLLIQAWVNALKAITKVLNGP